MCHFEFDRRLFRSRLRTDWLGAYLELHEALPSTMDRAAELAREGMHGAVVVAGQQTGGRGRRGRRWVSEPGAGLWFSAVVSAGLPMHRLLPLAPASGLALAEGLAQRLPCPPGVKWPNDVRVNGRKLAGVLAEASGQSGAAVVIGVGINLWSAPQGLHAVSLHEAGGAPGDPEELLADLLGHLERRWQEVLSRGFESLVSAWNARCDHLGRTVQVLDGGQEEGGYCEGIDSRGRLRIRRASGEVVAVGAGELIVRASGPG